MPATHPIHPAEPRPTLPVGRALRLLLGACSLLPVALFLAAAGWSAWGQALGVAVLLVLFYAAVHWLVSSFFTRLDSCVGAFLALLPLAAVFVSGGPAAQAGALLFLGVSLLAAALRADPGCEVMSLPALLFGRRTHLVCLLFSPIDWAERKLSR